MSENLKLILSNKATLEDLVELNEKKGISVVIEDGFITEVHYGK